MPRHELQSPASVYLVADHLDAALAAGEDLLAVNSPSNAPLATHAAKAAEIPFSLQRRFVERVRTLELVMVMRVLQARQRAEDLRRADARVAPVASIFIGGTAALADAAEELGDATHVDFQTGDDTISYLRSRGVISADAASLVNLNHLIVTSRFLIAERIELGALLDLSATFLDTLELFFELYVEEPLIETKLAAIDVTTDRATTF